MNGKGLPFSFLWFGPGLLWTRRKLHSWRFGLHFPPQPLMPALGMSWRHRAQTATLFLHQQCQDCSTRKEVCPRARVSRHHLHECGSNGRCHGAAAAWCHNAQHKPEGCSSLVPPQQEQRVSLVPPRTVSGCRRAGLLPAGLNQPHPIHLPAVN